MRIIITVPQKEGEKWFLGYNFRPRGMARADTVFSRLERLLLRSTLKQKTSVLVRYGKGAVNETVASLDPRYLLYAASCFLEDYLSKFVMERARRTYLLKKS